MHERKEFCHADFDTLPPQPLRANSRKNATMSSKGRPTMISMLMDWCPVGLSSLMSKLLVSLATIFCHMHIHLSSMVTREAPVPCMNLFGVVHLSHFSVLPQALLVFARLVILSAILFVSSLLYVIIALLHYALISVLLPPNNNLSSSRPTSMKFLLVVN